MINESGLAPPFKFVVACRPPESPALLYRPGRLTPASFASGSNDLLRSKELRSSRAHNEGGSIPRCSLCEEMARFPPVAQQHGRHLLFLGRRCCKTLLPFSFKWQPHIATTFHCQKISSKWSKLEQ